MPKTAQERTGRGPLATLLILLSLLLGPGTAAARADIGEPAARFGAARNPAAAALLPPGIRNPLDDEAPDREGGSSVPPAGPRIVTERLWARPLAGASAGGRGPLPRQANASYRARAPPAS